MRGVSSFRAFTVPFSRRGWVEGNRCEHLFTLIGGAFGVHPSGPGRRVRRTLFLFALPPFDFYVLGGGVGCRRLLLLAATLLVHMSACPQDGQSNFCFDLGPFNYHGLGGGEEKGLSTSLYYQRRHNGRASERVPGWRKRERDASVYLLSAAALLACMSVDREGECARHFYLLSSHRLTLTKWVERRSKE